MVKIYDVLKVVVPIAGVGALVYALRARAARIAPAPSAPAPTAPVAPTAVTITLRAVYNTEELSVDFRGVVPEGTWTTPTTITVPDDLVGKTLTFMFPTSVALATTTLTISTVDNGTIVSSTPDETRIDVDADKSKEVVVHYSPEKVVARWVGSDGSVIEVYDIWYRVPEDRMGMKFRFSSGGVYKVVKVREMYDENRDVSIREFKPGSYIFEWSTYSAGKPYGVVIEACMDTTSCSRVIKILKDEIRDISS